MQNICFVANYSKTYLFHAIAQVLADEQVQVSWICTNRGLYDFLSEQYPAEALLLINLDHLDKPQAPIQEFKLNELVLGDRVFRHTPEVGLQFLQNIQQDIYDFLQKQDCRFVFGEITWAHELLIHRICSRCAELNCQYLNPHVVRLPNRRFAFFTDEYQSEFYESGQARPAAFDMIEVRPPSYLKINDKIQRKARSIKGRLDRIRRFITNENIDKKDPTHIVSERIRLSVRSKEELYKETYKLVPRQPADSVRGENYVFLGLHKQPEASIDVLGRYYEDQLCNIRNIWRVLPNNWKLVVKEHTNAIGDRGLAFYKNLQQLPNLILVDEKTPSYDLIKEARAVVTVSGTMAYEAALMKIPAFTFAPTFFNRLNCCRRLELRDLQSCGHFKQLIWQLESSYDNRLKFSNYLMKHSFEGVFIDPVTLPDVMQAENIALLSEAFQHIIHSKVKAASY
ncbi:MAG: hypothetical protein AAFV25_01900 [Bacteroidota bacterium]